MAATASSSSCCVQAPRPRTALSPLRPASQRPHFPSTFLPPLRRNYTLPLTHLPVPPLRVPRMAMAMSDASATEKVFHGECFVVRDNIDTDQIIPTEHLTLVPSRPEEYEKLGSLAMVGLAPGHALFVEEGQSKTRYPVIIAGANFGCGSSREHAPVALGASGVCAVVAESYARIFFRNCVATGELYPAECQGSPSPSMECKTGDIVTLDLERSILINHSQNRQYALKPLGDAGPVIDAGGLFAFARKSGLIAASTASICG